MRAGGIHGSREGSRRRGTAEIELMLVIPLLLTMLFLVGANLTLGGARIRNVFSAETAAYRDATVEGNPTLTGDGSLPVVDGFSSLPEGLPSRTHVSRPQATADVALGGSGGGTTSVTLTDRSAFVAPAWGYAGYPVQGDGATTAAWFADYASQARGPLEDPLGLAPSSPP
jgi:hypothetical protein